MSTATPAIGDRRWARLAAVAWALETLANPATVFIDTETTGLDATAEIVDIGIIDASGDVLFETLVRPDQRIPTDATVIHGITNAMVAGAPRWKTVYPEIERILAGRSVVVYNAAFDQRLVNQMNARHGFPRRNDGWACAMQRYGEWAGEWNAKYGNYRWHKLDTALRTFGHPVASHRALDDARACRLVVEGMARGE